jgi:hypothetical protein
VRLGVSTNSLYKWVKAANPSKADAQAAALNEAKKEILTLRAERRRVQEERSTDWNSGYWLAVPERASQNATVSLAPLWMGISPEIPGEENS